METVLDARLRWARALVAGSVAFVLGVTGHVMADGLLPGPVGLAVLLAFSVLLAMPVLGRRVSSVRTVGLLVGGQTFIHLCLTMTAGHRGEVRGHIATATPAGLSQLPVVDGRRVGSLQDAYLGTPDGAVTPVLPGHLIGDLQAHAPMMAVHLARCGPGRSVAGPRRAAADLRRDADRPPPAGRGPPRSSRSSCRQVSLGVVRRPPRSCRTPLGLAHPPRLPARSTSASRSSNRPSDL